MYLEDFVPIILTSSWFSSFTGTTSDAGQNQKGVNVYFVPVYSLVAHTYYTTLV